MKMYDLKLIYINIVENKNNSKKFRNSNINNNNNLNNTSYISNIIEFFVNRY